MANEQQARLDEAKAGHAAHTKPADSQEGLKGKVQRPINITFLGAGSGFCPTLCKDVLLMPGADRGEFRLVGFDRHDVGRVEFGVERFVFPGAQQFVESRDDGRHQSNSTPRVTPRGPVECAGNRLTTGRTCA